MQPPTVSVKEKGGKPDKKPYPFPYSLRNTTETSSLRTFKIMPRNFNVIVQYVHEFGFCIRNGTLDIYFYCMYLAAFLDITMFRRILQVFFYSLQSGNVV
jgi:hypothetical protein